MIESPQVTEVHASFLQRSENTFDTVDHKIAEVEFFLRRLLHPSSFEFNCYFSAYLSAARSVTLALQRFLDIDGMREWYEQRRETLKDDPLARTFKILRDDHVHGDRYPASGSWRYDGRSVSFV